MTKLLGFYWTPADKNLTEQIDLLVHTNANAVFIPHSLLNKELLDSLHEHGIRVLVDRSLFAGEELRRLFPDSAPVDAAGLPFDRDGWYMPVCPNHPQIRRHHLAAMEQFLNDYGDEIDGLWLDFIRFPVRWEVREPELRPLCFCKHCLNLFLQTERNAYTRAETRAVATRILHEQYDEWVAWKCGQIARFVEEIRSLIAAKRPALRLGMFVLPWRRADFDGAIRTVAGQDLTLLARHIDIFTPMVYHKLCHQPTSWIKSVIDDHAAWSQKPVLPIIQSVHQPDTMTPAQLDAALAQALPAAQNSTMIFTFAPLLASQELTDVVRRHFARYA